MNFEIKFPKHQNLVFKLQKLDHFYRKRPFSGSPVAQPIKVTNEFDSGKSVVNEILVFSGIFED
jgi:hypothetical protein